MQMKMRNINIIFIGFVLCGLALLDASFFHFNIIPNTRLVYFILAVVVTALYIKRIKGAGLLMCAMFFYHILSICYPSFYNMLYPYNNMEEDILWAVYDKQSLAMIFMAALGIALILYILNRFFWKIDSLWLCNMTFAFLFVIKLISTFPGVMKFWGLTVVPSGYLLYRLLGRLGEYPVLAAAWINAFFICCLLTKKRGIILSLKSRVSLTISVFMLPGILIGLVAFSLEIVKPHPKVYEGEDFSYVAQVEDEYGKEGLINERGEEVVPCVFSNGSINETRAFENTYILHICDKTGEYLFDEYGRLVSDEYESYELLDAEDYILVSNSEGRYGAIDPEGNMVIPLVYTSRIQMFQAEEIGEDSERQEIDKSGKMQEDIAGIQIVGEVGERKILDGQGHPILPGEYYEILLIGDSPTYICPVEVGAYLLEDGSHQIVFNDALFDIKGQELIPFGNHGISICDNGWIRVHTWEKGTRFLNQNMEEILNFEERYEAVFFFEKTRT